MKGLEMLTRGRVDLYPGNTALIDYQCTRLAGGCDNIRLVLPLADLEQDLYFALSADTGETVVTAIREQFNRLIAEGRLQALSEAFLNNAGN
jgi:ABC-type amino acid transport substrate-binding protein